MKTLLAMALAMVSTFAMSGEIKLRTFSAYERGYNTMTSQEFVANTELGRGGVKLSVVNFGEGEVGDDYIVKVEGLSFDTATQSFMINFEGKITKCAEYIERGRSIFRQKFLKMSPECKFEGRWSKSSVDSGFEVKTVKKYEVFLIVE